MPKQRTSRAVSPRIDDVARLAGVSAQTVSNVVNERGGYSDDTRRRVLNAMTRTGYRPNRAAQQLRTRRSRQIGFPLGRGDDEPDQFVLTFLKALAGAAQPSSHRIVVFACDRDDTATLQHWVDTGELDAFAFCAVSPGDPRTRLLTDLRVPFSVMGRTAADEPQTWVDTDGRAAMTTIVDYLVGKGHSSFAYLGHRSPAHWTIERRQGVSVALAGHGLRLAPQARLVGSLRSLGRRIDELLTSRSSPTALIADSDSLALLAMGRARALGMRVGTDVAVTGFQSGLYLGAADPPLTAIRIPVEAAAGHVVGRLVREVESGPTGLPGLILPTSLTVGRSA